MKKHTTFDFDKLEITYEPTKEFNDILTDFENSISLGENDEFQLKRVPDDHLHYRYVYSLSKGDVTIGKLYWDTYIQGRKDVYLLVDNKLLYNKELLSGISHYGQILGLKFKCISKLDICLDTSLNIVSAMCKLLRDKNENIVLNGKCIKDRKMDVDAILHIGRGSLNRFWKHRQIVLANAAKNISVKFYDKALEIDQKSHKDYIREAINGSKRIYRMEVSLVGSKKIREVLRKLRIEQEYLYLHPFDESNENSLGKLAIIFRYALNRIVRLKGYKHIPGERSILAYFFPDMGMGVPIGI